MTKPKKSKTYKYVASVVIESNTEVPLKAIKEFLETWLPHKADYEISQKHPERSITGFPNRPGLAVASRVRSVDIDRPFPKPPTRRPPPKE